MSDMYLGSQAPLYQNVRLRCINKKTGKCRVERTAKNRVTRLMLWGISKFLAGEFNDSTPDKIYEYVPRYLALGTNTPGTDAASAGVTTLVTVNDTRLLNEITVSSSTGETTSVQRISIQSRQHMKTTTRFTDPFVKLSLTIYVSSHQFDGMEIGEAGLFSKQRDNNCVARVVFSPFKKGEDEVIEICWDITLLSYGETKYPNNITIDEASKIIIPLYYSSYHIQSTHLNLTYVEELSNTGWIYLKSSEFNIPLFSVDTNGRIAVDDTLISLNKNTGEVVILDGPYKDVLESWSTYLEANEIRFDNVIRQLVLYGTKSGDNIIFKSSETLCSMYFSEAERLIDNITLLADAEGALLQDRDQNFIQVEGEASVTTSGKGLYVSRIYKQEIDYETVSTSYIISKELDKIIETNENYTAYTIHNRQIFKLSGDQEIETDGYIENGRIMCGDSPTEYVYDTITGVISKIENSGTSETITSAFIVPQANKYKICQTTPYENVTSYTKYWIDWDTNKSVYHEENGDTEYHVTNDLFFATGDTHKLPYTITPTDATDKTVVWGSLNSNIAPVSQYGIVTGWNVGETYITVTTSNGIKARTVVEVVKNLSIVKTLGIELDPSSIAFDASSIDPQYTIVTANVQPVSATYNVVNWSLDANADALFSFAPLKNNKVKVWSNATGNVGRGYLVAKTADGVTAKCLLQLLSNNQSDIDCPQDIHDDQHSS